ncbi:unnamed protein product [Gongylonema pulchrum]|uniref:Hemopexin n=1 Tax=Gongylonema pulchrum TaxID=637853 RepID=A0A183E831_9BILA|nr:unnamed protein product [Gongylonema pulchrum]
MAAIHQYHCPSKLDAATEKNQIINSPVAGRLYIFSDGKVWIFKDRRPEMAVRIGKIFAGGPQYVNASVSTKHHTYLIADRTIYAFNVDKTTETFSWTNKTIKGIYRPTRGWPKILQNRVLFFPQAAFPIENGSAILISGDVFATYDLASNRASLINDLKLYYPNLPEDFKSGIPYPAAQYETYHLFDSHIVYEYDMSTHQITFAQPLKKYLAC